MVVVMPVQVTVPAATVQTAEAACGAISATLPIIVVTVLASSLLR